MGAPIHVADTGAGRREKQRSRTGCRTCRSRKVKCDERPGGCYNCARLNLPCPNSAAYHNALLKGEAEGEYLRTQAGLRRSRTYRSCRGCRSSKSRCSGERPTCLRCRQRDIQCCYDGKEAPAWLEVASQEADGRGRRGSSKGGTPSSSGAMHSHPSSPALSHAGSSPSSSRHRGTTSEPDLAATTTTESSSSSSWLLAHELPRSREHVVQLVEAFFANMHSLRCFGFIHRPSVLRHLEHWSSSAWYEHQGNALLLVVCALGAKFYAVKHGSSMGEGGDGDGDGDGDEDGDGMDGESQQRQQQFCSGNLALSAGCHWARRAQQVVLLGLDTPSVENAMAVVLLHEHELRVGNHACAFMLTGLGVRMAQALQINIESSPDILCRGQTKDKNKKKEGGVGGGGGQQQQGLSPTTREARRRLMWSIYTMDAWVGSGVDELTLLREADVQIQLPCSDHSFDAQRPRIVEALRPGTFLPFVSAEDRRQQGSNSGAAVERLDLQAYFIRLVSIRRKVLRFVKHLDQAQPPWLPQSEFAMLQAQLQHWVNHLPDSMRLTRGAIHRRKEASQLGGMLFCHFTYHQTMCDLARIGMRDIFPMRGRLECPPEQASFTKRVQDQCFEHCMAICGLFEEALGHGQEALADTWLSVVAHDSARVVIHCITAGVGSAKEKGEVFKMNAVTAVHSNIRALHAMIPVHSLARPLHAATVQMLLAAGLPIPRSSVETNNGNHLHSSTPIVLVSSDQEAAGGRATITPPPHPTDAGWGSPPQYTPDQVLNPLAIFRMARRTISDREKHSCSSETIESCTVNITTTTSADQDQHHRQHPTAAPFGEDHIHPGLLPPHHQQHHHPHQRGLSSSSSSAFDLGLGPQALSSMASFPVGGSSSYATPASSSPAPSTMFLDDTMTGGLPPGYGDAMGIAAGAAFDDLHAYNLSLVMGDIGMPLHSSGGGGVMGGVPSHHSAVMPDYDNTSVYPHPPHPVSAAGAVSQGAPATSNHDFGGVSMGTLGGFQEDGSGHMLNWDV